MVRITRCGLFSSRAAADLLLLLSLLLVLVSTPAAQTLESRTWTLGNPFSNDYRTNMTTLGNASVNGDALQLTPDTRNNPDYLLNKAGRVLLPDSLKIWDDGPQLDLAPNSSVAAAPAPAPAQGGGRLTNNSTGSSQKTVISFSTIFDFNVYRDPNQSTVGEGMAFIITGNGDSMPPGSHGQYLGLTNASTDGNASNQLVAVEFDTFKQPYDPDDNHVGLNINSVVSSVTSSLSNFNITISPPDAPIYRAWIDYNGTERHIYVYMALLGDPKPPSPVLNASVDLSEHLPRRAYFGFAGSTGPNYELNCVLAWNLTAEILPEDDDLGPWDWFLRVGVPVLAVAAAAGVALLLYAHRRKARRDERLVGTLKSLPGTPREFQYRVLKRATNNFDEKNRLGEGGFGVVYRGVIPRENLELAVKMFSRETMQGDFLAELTIINRLRHKHLVRLLGWCHKNGKLLLVYDYMPNGSLDTHLFNAPPGGHLPWDCRYRVLTGVASALHYLHNEYDQKVVHRDLKASNVLLDAAFEARLGDFGLARAIDNGRTSYAEVELDGVPGTVGYIAHECFHTGKATRESDVFGFGAVVLEVVCGRRPRCDIGGFRLLADWVWSLHREGNILDAVDPRLGGDYVAEDAQRLLLLGLACSHPNPGDRPKTQAIAQIISRSVPPPEVPPFRPPFVWPSAAISIDGMGEETTTTDSGSVTQATSSLYSSASVYSPQFTSRDSTDFSMP